MQLISAQDNISKLPIEQCLSNISGWCGNQQSAYSGAAIRQFEDSLFTSGLSAQVLMRRAARVSYELIAHRFDYIDTVNIICGGGNNGADGIALAAICAQHGKSVNLILADTRRTNLGNTMLEWAKTTTLTVYDIDAADSPKAAWQVFIQQQIDQPAVWVDALFGIGLNRNISGIFEQIITDLNLLPAMQPLLSLDIPSGLDGDTGAVLGHCVKATMTLSFLALKIGCITNHGRQQCGDLYLSSLLLSQEQEQRKKLQTIPQVKLFTVKKQSTPLLSSSFASHKNSWGNVLVLSGDRQMAGAVELVIQGALAGGCGKVRTLSDFPLHNMSQSLLGTWDELEQYLVEYNTIIIGPGMAQSTENTARLEQLLVHASQDSKIVIDAGALPLFDQIFAQRPDLMAQSAQIILTPHPKEAAKMLHCSLSQVTNDRLAAGQKLANKFQAWILLKGSGTVIIQPNNAKNITADVAPMMICPQGNALLATGGTGDMLAGLLGALLARGIEQTEACALASAVMGHCSDKLAVLHGMRGLHLSELTLAMRRLLFGS